MCGTALLRPYVLCGGVKKKKKMGSFVDVLISPLSHALIRKTVSVQ